jgi:hypothetical protein
MKLEGSCHCGAVRFSVISHTPYPYMRCYCSICRKTGGGGGYAINLMGDVGSLEVTGRDHISVYVGRRHFCARCGSALWVWDERWPELVHPFASAIDTDLPAAPDQTHIMLNYRASWVKLPPPDASNAHFEEYPDASIEEWHRKRDLWVD